MPPGVVTETLFAPATCDGVTAVTVVVSSTVTPVASLVPSRTAVAPVRFVPVMVIVVPPAVGPRFGVTAVTVGAARFAW